jgi:hypothetical protein
MKIVFKGHTIQSVILGIAFLALIWGKQDKIVVTILAPIRIIKKI